MAGVRGEPCAAFKRATGKDVACLSAHGKSVRGDVHAINLAKVHNPGRLVIPLGETLAAHFVIALHHRIKNQREDWESLVHDRAEVRVVAAGEGRAGLLDFERTGLLAEINEVVEILGDEHFRHAQPVGLLETQMLMRVEVLK